MVIYENLKFEKISKIIKFIKSSALQTCFIMNTADGVCGPLEIMNV